jgi:type 1 glutamine amidotransferase
MRLRIAALAVAASAVIGITVLAQQAPAPAPAPAAGQAPAGGRQGGGRQTGPVDMGTAAGGGASTVEQRNVTGMRIYIRAGIKTHGEGLHDYPQLLADWSKLLTEKGAIVDGSLHSPSAAELEKTDVVILYKGDPDLYMSPKDKTDLEAFVKRGGGIVSIHDSMCAGDQVWWANTISGGAKKHGEQNFSAGELKTVIVDKTNPIMEGISDFTIQDEAFHTLTWAPNAPVKVLATVAMPGGTKKDEVVPQLWTWEHTLAGGQPSRAFVWMQGHLYKNIFDPTIQKMMLRGIAWAGKKPVNELVDYVAPPRGGGRGRGRGGQ